MGVVLTLRAQEMETLRGKNRRLRRRLAGLEEIARDNDAMVSMLHKLSLLLVARKSGWREEAELLLRRSLKAADCSIVVFGRRHEPLSAKTARLPAGGRVSETPLRGVAETGALYYHLPLKHGRKAAGLVILKFLPKNRFREGGADLCRRTAELLAAAL